jgi:lipopolysaccharide export system protein LptA
MKTAPISRHQLGGHKICIEKYYYFSLYFPIFSPAQQDQPLLPSLSLRLTQPITIPIPGSIYIKGNVRIEVGSRVITAGQAKASLSSLEVWSSNGITLTQDDIVLTAGSVYVYGTRNTAALSGDVKLSQPHITITADTADFNWRTKLATFTDNVQVTQGNDTWSAASVTYNV